MNGKWQSIYVLLSAFAISSLGGLAALLRSHKPLNLRTVLSALLYSGMMGLIIALMWYNVFAGRENLYFLLGVSGLAGIGGVTVVDFIVQVFKRGGLNVRIEPKDGEDD